MSKRNYSRPIEPVVHEPETTEVIEPIVQEPEVKRDTVGVVVECDRLNVRKAPNTSATVLCVINRDEKVTVDEQKSKGQFYKVRLASGVEGYCMKNYISLQM